MSSPEEPSSLFQPGDSIVLADITELAEFEDLVIAEVNPDYRPELWAARVALKNIMRPDKFNGRMTDVTLTVLESPLDQLRTARERGHKLLTNEGKSATTGKLGQSSSEHFSTIAHRARGFTLTADAYSSGRGLVGQVQSELYYYPLIPSVVAKDSWKQNTRNGEVRSYQAKKDYLGDMNKDQMGRTINRIVTKPIIETQRFTELHETSRRIGLSVLRKAMMNPIKTPMQN